MDKQRLFNDAYLGLKKQGFAKSIKGFQCLYRGPNGLKCAIGHCIPDERYDESFEGKKISSSGVYFIIEDEYGTVDYDFIIRLQVCHDDSHSPEEMENSLHLLALDEKLSIPEGQ